MKKLYIVSLLFAMISTSASAQDSLWAKVKSDTRFYTNQMIDITGVDSIDFSGPRIRFTKDGKKSTQTYTNFEYFSFHNPGRSLYCPGELKQNDWDSEQSEWCFQRSMESEHFIVFWHAGFGLDPTKATGGYAFNPKKMLDAAITWHPSDINEIPSGTNNSCIQVLYKFKGLASHACSAYSGRSALDAVELMNVGVQFLREHMTPDCYIHYAITDAGGASPNVVQPTASVLYMVRANRVKDSIKLQKRVDKIAEGAALMTETSYDRTFIDGTADLLPNYTLEEILHESLTEFGVPEYTDEEMEYASALKSTYEIDVVPSFAASVDAEMAKYVKDNTGDLSKTICDFIMPVYHSRAFTPGSTDVGDVSWLTPTAQIHTACFTLGSPGHSWQNVSCGKTSVAHKGMLLAAKALALSAVKLMEDETLLRIAKKEFAERSEDGYTCPIEPDAVPIAI